MSRHILDHYRLLLDGLDHPQSIVNYDTRERDLPLETSREAALEALRSLVQRFGQAMPRVDLAKPLHLLALTPEAQELETTFGREVRLALSCRKVFELDVAAQLWFASLHASMSLDSSYADFRADNAAVHHYSLIRVRRNALLKKSTNLLSLTGHHRRRARAQRALRLWRCAFDARVSRMVRRRAREEGQAERQAVKRPRPHVIFVPSHPP